jgi:hypothetical protein
MTPPAPHACVTPPAPHALCSLHHVPQRARAVTRRARGARQETQKGDIALALEWMPVELDDD